jgi:thiosulfate reductase cytochrome b subunit
MNEVAWGWTLFAALLGWMVGIGMGIRHQKKMANRAALDAMRKVARDILDHAMAQGHAGTVRIFKDGEMMVEEGDIPTEGPPKH